MRTGVIITWLVVAVVGFFIGNALYSDQSVVIGISIGIFVVGTVLTYLYLGRGIPLLKVKM